MKLVLLDALLLWSSSSSTTTTTTVSSFQPLILRSNHHHHHYHHLHGFVRSRSSSSSSSSGARCASTRCWSNKNEDDEIDISNQDWRAFRAKLVMQADQAKEEDTAQQRQQQQPPLPAASLDDDFDGIGALFEDDMPTFVAPSASLSDRWAYESGNVIEQGAVILGGVEQAYGFGLRQQYFHKAAILVLAHDSKFTRGIILNRPTDYFIDGVWRVWFGGDVGGLRDEEPELVCLHSIVNNEKVKKASNVVMNDIQWTSFETAKQLVKAGAAKPSDFWVFAGYAGWGPNQLAGELERKSWYMVATDSQTLLQQLARESDPDPRGAGLETWNMLMTMIGKEGMASEDGDEFDDLMLTEWVRHNLLTKENGGEGKSLGPEKKTYDGKNVADVGEGSLVRASSKPRSPFLLSYQDLHKSLVLILADDDELSIGVILNLPSSQGFEIRTKDTKTGKETAVAIPVRYGGEHAIQGDQVLWLHCSPALRGAGIGKEIGKNKNNIWKCSAQDVTSAIGNGLASPTDFLVFSGVTAWTKNNPLSAVDGIQSEVESGTFEVVPTHKTEKIWATLSQQQVLEKRDIEVVWKNIGISSRAWELGTNGKPPKKKDAESLVFNSTVSVEDLADDAHKNWVYSHLLGIGL